MSMKITIKQPCFCNETGRRENNEDSIYPRPQMADTSSSLFLVCDGMGGHQKGEVASMLVSQSFADFWIINSNERDTEKKVRSALNEAIKELDKNTTPENKGMGTTLTLASVGDSSVLIAHIGDSRIYHIRPQVGIVYKTKDHSLVQAWVDAGLLTPEQARVHPKKNVITRAVQSGTDEIVIPEVAILTDFEDGDYLFLCTDGVVEAVEDDKLVEILSGTTDDEEKMHTIVELCEAVSKDNYSAYLIPLSVSKDASEPVCELSDELEMEISQRQRERQAENRVNDYFANESKQPYMTEDEKTSDEEGCKDETDEINKCRLLLEKAYGLCKDCLSQIGKMMRNEQR